MESYRDPLFSDCVLSMACIRSKDAHGSWFTTRNGKTIVLDGNTFTYQDKQIEVLQPLMDWLNAEHKEPNEVCLCVNETKGYASIMSPEMEQQHKVRSLEGHIAYGITMG